MKDESKIQHPDRVAVKSCNRPLVSPIYQSVKFESEDLESFFGDYRSHFSYSRISNPTCVQLESELASIQHCESGLVFASGIAAVTTTLMSFLKSGDHVILFMESYRPSRMFVRSFLSQFGVTSTLLSFTELKSLESHVQPGRTRLILFESPSNPITRIPDIGLIVSVAQKFKILSILDNTFSGLHQNRSCGVDLYIHSLTKFAAGHGDVLGGAVLGPHTLIDKIHPTSVQLGAILDPHSAFLIMRGLKTFLLRYERLSENTSAVARALEQNKSITRVYYPGLESHPDHAIARRQMKQFGAVFSIDLATDGPSVEHFIKNLKMIPFVVSLGSTETLVAPALALFGSDLTESERKTCLITDRTVRFSVGLESPDDIVADIEGALQ